VDSVTQITLGAAVSVAVMHRRVPVWKAALWGALAGTSPDLDVVVDFGDAIQNMTRHRAETHAIAYLTLAAPFFAGVATWLGRESAVFGRWLLAFWLVFMTHIAIDYLTVYGTQLFLPWTRQPFGLGSVFIIDPAYTLPLLIGLVVCLASRSAHRWRWNTAGLVISTLYLAWGIGVQQHVTQIARASLPVDVAPDAPLLVTPSPLNSILWRLVLISPDHYHEGWYSLLDPEPVVHWQAFDRGQALIQAHEKHPGAQEIKRFSRGFYRMHERDGDVFITDLRMGLEPAYFFDFNLGPVNAQGQLDATRISTKQGARANLDAGLPWLWQRIRGNTATWSGG
jgi:inner membrane protein